MKTTSKLSILFFLIIGFFLFQATCSFSQTAKKRKYLSAAEPGDLVYFFFGDDSYRAHNLVTDKVVEGNYVEMPGGKSSLYMMEKNDETYYAVELYGKFIATNFPCGTIKPSISTGISESINNQENMEDGYYEGLYTWIVMDLDGTHDLMWGIAGFQDDQWRAWPFFTSKTLPKDLTSDIGPSDPELNGFIYAQPENPNLLVYERDGYKDLVGSGFADEDEAVLFFDLGVNNGYMQAIKITEEADNLAGDYNFILTDVKGGNTAGIIDMEEDGAFRMEMFGDGDQIIETISDEPLDAGVQPNMFYIETEANSYYFFFCGRFIMFMIMEGDKLVSYAIGAKLDPTDDDDLYHDEDELPVLDEESDEKIDDVLKKDKD